MSEALLIVLALVLLAPSALVIAVCARLAHDAQFDPELQTREDSCPEGEPCERDANGAADAAPRTTGDKNALPAAEAAGASTTK